MRGGERGNQGLARADGRALRRGTAGLERLPGGELRETLADNWVSDYSEDPASGLWTATVYRHDTEEWQSRGYASLEDAVQAARDYYAQL